MGLDALKAALPEYAKDIKLNLGSVIATSTLPASSSCGARPWPARWPRAAAVMLTELAAEANGHLTAGGGRRPPRPPPRSWR